MVLHRAFRVNLCCGALAHTLAKLLGAFHRLCPIKYFCGLGLGRAALTKGKEEEAKLNCNKMSRGAAHE